MERASKSKSKLRFRKRMYNNNNEKSFAYLLNGGPCLPLVCVVELSKFANIDRMALQFYETKKGGSTKVLNLPKEWDGLIRNCWKIGDE
mmetsp:Transcript_2205/g.3095  ORF Transcript_2205/g.3095 Transcript_2205/m.3095 type:complete len:89 (+) Transcript_2205:124-390(+)